jgi:hypothetical protein
MLRFASLALLLSLALVRFPALAQTHPPAKETSTPRPLREARPAVIDGAVATIDLRTSMLTIQSTAKRYEVKVLPSTTFRCKHGAPGCHPGFMSITDIAKEAKVHIEATQRGGEYEAQTITIVK